jgi:EAL domain-containing protein (putative c-di-GMP-specific phosphodiesterase class I)
MGGAVGRTGIAVAPREAGDRVEPLPALGDVYPWVGERFSQAGALGVLLVDGSALLRVEGIYGADASMRCQARLGALVRDACSLRPHDLVVSGETGRAEVLVFIFRERAQGEFWERELPRLSEAVATAAAKQGARLFYPYLRRVVPLPRGTAAALRNPIWAATTQLRRALEEARADADLTSRLEARARRQGLMSVVLQRRIHSVYEPIVDAKTLTVYGYEALARGPAGTPFASAAALFGAAESSGLIYDLDCLCREAGIEGAVDFPEGTKLFLNIRPSAFHDPSFQPDELRRTLERCRLKPSDVVLEISEQESIENFNVFRQARDDYGKLGFQFAMDDTGAGYASFEAVLELRPEFVKVDRAFVAGSADDPARQAILLGFQSIAERIRARIIGEGLDTLEELQTLARLGIPFGQGWLFGKPTPLRAETGNGGDGE